MNKKDLEGRLVLLASDSKASRKMAGDIANHFDQDHLIGGRIVRLNVNRIPYSNGRENFEVVDPKGVLSTEERDYLIKHSDTYFISKLENPLLADPLKYLLNPIIKQFGQKYTALEKLSPGKKKLKNMFISYLASNLPVELKDVVKAKVLDEELIPIANNILKIFNYYKRPVTKIFEEYKLTGNLNLNDERLKYFKWTLKGFLKDIVDTKSTQIYLDEKRAISELIGNNILQEEDPGRFHWVMPFIDGRSDKNKTNPNECIRVEDTAKLAQNTGVHTVFMTRAHSPAQINSFESKNVHVINLTQTIEYISLMVDSSIEFQNSYVMGPDFGSMTDSMVFAREMSIRTDGEFSGRVVIFKKTRIEAGEIEKMEFYSSYLYNPEKEKPEDLIIKDDNDHHLPYDIIHNHEYKNPESEFYIKNLFKEEFNSSQEEDLIKLIKGHDAIVRDDLVASGKTLIKSSRVVANDFESNVYAFCEHPSLTGPAIENLNKLYNDGILKVLYTSTSIFHPNSAERPWHKPRTMADRYKKYMKKSFMKWLKNSYQADFDKLLKYSK